MFHEDMSGKVSVGGVVSEAVTINHGMKQGCIFTPTLLTFYLTVVLVTMTHNLVKGVFIRTR